MLFFFPPLLEGSIFDHSQLIEVDPDVDKSWFEPVCFGSQLIATYHYIRSNGYRIQCYGVKRFHKVSDVVKQVPV